MISTYGKAIAAVVTAAVVVAYQALSGDQLIEATEWVSIAIAAVTAAGVYLIPLAPNARWTKSLLAAVLAVLQVLTTVILGGIGADELILMLITAAGALGIYIAPARTDTLDGRAIAVGTGSDS